MECAACFRVAPAFASVVIGHRDGGANHGGSCHRAGRADMTDVVIGVAVQT